MSSGPRPIIAGVTTALITFVAYLPGLGRSLDFDSAETVGFFIRPGPPWAAFRRQAVFNNHPFFSFLEQLVRVVTGRVDAATIRVLPIAFGAATVGILTWYCGRRFGSVAGVAGGVLVAVNPTFIDLSREVRGYSLVALCALVSTIIVLDDLIPAGQAPSRPRRSPSVLYVAAVSAGVATHLFMLVVVVTHLAMIAVARRLDERWRRRFLTISLLSALAYAGLVRTMLDAAGEHVTVFQPRLPTEVAESLLGGGWAAVVALPVAAVGIVGAARWRVVRVGLAAFGVTFVALWVLYRSDALAPRFFVFLVPAFGMIAAVAIRGMRTLVLATTLSTVLALASIVPGYRDDPTSYREAAALIRSVDSAGARSCVVDVGVSPMEAYVDAPEDFAIVTDPGQLQSCDVVVVASWWDSDADWYRADRAVIAAAEQRFDHEVVLRSDDPALVLSNAPLSKWTASA